MIEREGYNMTGRNVRIDDMIKDKKDMIE